MFLATTALSEFWEKEDEILFLGPWCLRYDRPGDWKGLKYTIFQNPWREQLRIHQAEQYCSDVIERTLDELVPRLNQAQATNHSHRYWRVILGPWLLYYVHALYDRYIHLKQALRSISEIKTICLDPRCFRTPVCTIDFIRMMYEDCGDLLNLQLYSQIVSALQIQATTRRPIAQHEPICQRSLESALRSISSGLRQRLQIKSVGRWTISKLAGLVGGDVWMGEIRMNRRDRWRLAWALGLRSSPIAESPVFTVERDNILPEHDRRELFNHIHSTDEFQMVLRETLPQNFPILYLEGYKIFRNGHVRQARKLPKVFFSSTDWYFNEVFKFNAAEGSEHGSRLLGCQHGGGYGLSKTIPQEQHELAIVDAWYSFGWKPSGGDGKVKSIPHPRFAPLKRPKCDDGRECNTDVLLITTSYPRYPYRFESHPVRTFDSLLEWRTRFVLALQGDLQNRLVIRLSRQDYGWCQQSRLVDSCGNLRFDQGAKPLREAMLNARMVVIEYHGTVMLEALAADIPTVLYWNPQDWEFRDEAKPFVDDLRKVGILWDTPEEAAAKVAECFDAACLWWRSEALQEVRHRFAERYAFWRQDWVGSWAHAMEDELASTRSAVDGSN